MNLPTACQHIKQNSPNIHQATEQPGYPELPRLAYFHGNAMTFKSPEISYCERDSTHTIRHLDIGRNKNTHIKCRCKRLTPAGFLHCACSQELAITPFAPNILAVTNDAKQRRLATLRARTNTRTPTAMHRQLARHWNPIAWKQGYLNFHQMFYCDPVWRGQIEALGITKP